MIRRIINFGDIQLIGAVGEWGLVLTDLAGANDHDISCHSTRKFIDRMVQCYLIHVFICSLLYRVDKEMHESKCCASCRLCS
jgi:hypothetical protein